MSDYTHTRITKEYLDKLQVLAAANKRSAMKQLEVLIDEASYTAPPRPHEIKWTALGASCSCGLLFAGRSNAAKHAREANGAQPPTATKQGKQ